MAAPPQRLCSSVHSPYFAFFISCIWFADTHLHNENNELSFPEMEQNPRPVLEKRERIAATSGLLFWVAPAIQGLQPLSFTVLLCYWIRLTGRCQLKLVSVWQWSKAVSAGFCCRAVPLFVGYCVSLHKHKYLILYIFVNMGFTDLVVVAWVHFGDKWGT